jgi:hypothetical protein
LKIDAYYLIEPRSELREHLHRRVDDALADILLEPIVLCNSEGGRTIWTEKDHAMTVKLTFLASLKQYDPPLGTDAGFEHVLGSSLISIDLFDRWWTIRRLMLDDSTKMLWPYLANNLDRVKRTGNTLVDAWLAWVKQHC